MRHILFIVATLTTATFMGCADNGSTAECAEDLDCNTGFFCDGGSCKCRAEDACGEGQVCNAFGACQPRPPCIGNLDCDDGFICNSSSFTGGSCIRAENCGSSVHCDYNQYCRIEPGSELGACTPGCRNTGDCQLGNICIAGACEPSQVGGDCTQCPANPTPDSQYCDYGEKCSPSGQCVAINNQASLCDQCDDFSNPCPSDQKCIIDQESCSCRDGTCYPDGGVCNTSADCSSCTTQSYCAPKCSIDADCPNGYLGCGSIIIVCGSCSTASPICDNGGQCVLGPESDSGFCSCTSLECELYGLAYTELSPGVGVCQDPDSVCGKEPGVICEELGPDDAVCQQL